MTAFAVRPKRGFRDDQMYCPRCSVVWPRGYPVGGGVTCPMPRRGDRCGARLVPAEEAYERETTAWHASRLSINPIPIRYYDDP